MKRLTGYTMFCIGIGILLSLFLPGTFCAVILTAFLLIAGYCLFCG